MAFIDEITIHARAGNGGDGVVRWRREKFKEFSGPSGGDGGNGGSVILRGTHDLGRFSKLVHVASFEAEHGGHGMKDDLHGKNGEDKVIEIPAGCVVRRLDTDEEWEVLENGQEIVVLKGGRGGRGNASFKSSRNQAPEEFTPGTPAEEADIHLELRLIADVGFIGLPNAGKTSLLNALTRAEGKVGAYPFTTIEPALGVMYGRVLADIPGLIEGAASGKGLGHKFLRHVTRTKLLAHVLSLETDDVMDRYSVIRDELQGYGEGLSEKNEVIILSKSDIAVEDSIISTKKAFEKMGKTVCIVSVHDVNSVKMLGEVLLKIADTQ